MIQSRMGTSDRRRRTLKDIAHLFVSAEVDALGVISESEARAFNVKIETESTNPKQRELYIAVEQPSSSVATLPFLLSFCRWLLVDRSQVTLVASAPTADFWREVAVRFGLNNELDPFDLNPVQTFAISDRFRLLLTESGLMQRGGPVPVDLQGRSDEANLNRREVIVQMVPRGFGKEAQEILQRCDVWISLLPARFDAFVDFYRVVKSVREKAKGCEILVVLDHTRKPYPLIRFDELWKRISEQHLDLSISMIGQVNTYALTDNRTSLFRKMKLCEEHLGPPWPADILAMRRSLNIEQTEARERIVNRLMSQFPIAPDA